MTEDRKGLKRTNNNKRIEKQTGKDGENVTSEERNERKTKEGTK